MSWYRYISIFHYHQYGYGSIPFNTLEIYQLSNWSQYLAMNGITISNWLIKYEAIYPISIWLWVNTHNFRGINIHFPSFTNDFDVHRCKNFDKLTHPLRPAHRLRAWKCSAGNQSWKSWREISEVIGKSLKHIWLVVWNMFFFQTDRAIHWE